MFAYQKYKSEDLFMARVDLNTHAPEFALPDFNGKIVSLSGFANRKNVLAVFNRGFI
jgi:peroxiredoxin